MGSAILDWFVLKVMAVVQMFAVDWQRLAECKALTNDFAEFYPVK